MKQDEIIEMARQTLSKDIDGLWLAGTPDLEAFAKLVAAKEREMLANHFDNMPSREMFGGTFADEIRARGEA